MTEGIFGDMLLLFQRKYSYFLECGGVERVDGVKLQGGYQLAQGGCRAVEKGECLPKMAGWIRRVIGVLVRQAAGGSVEEGLAAGVLLAVGERGPEGLAAGVWLAAG